MKLPILAVMLIFPQLVFANCNYGEEIDLRKTHSRIYSGLPVFNQGQHGTCYAYSGAHLVDFYRIKGGGTTADNISPLEAGVLSKVYSQDHGEYGGNTCDVVNALNQRGYACKKSMVRNEYMYKDLGIEVHKELVQVYMPFILNEQVFRPLSKDQILRKKSGTKTQLAFLKRFEAAYKKISSKVLTKGFKTSDVPTLSSLILVSQKVHLEKRWGAMAGEFNLLILDKYCAKGRLSLPKLRNCYEEKESEYEMISEIDRALDRRTPVGISYCAQFLTNKKYVGKDYNGEAKANCSAHASVIIGRRPDNYGKCSYLIRNSWGRSSYAWPVSKDDIWVDEKALKNNLTGVSVIQ